MSNITSQNSIRYNIDTLDTKTTGLLVSKGANAVNLSRASRVTKINIGGLQPSGTYRYFAFKLGGKWGRITSTGTFQAFATNAATFDILEASGNVPADFSSLNSIPALAGQSFGLAIALSTINAQTAIPTASISFACVTDSQQLTATEISPVYELGQDSHITNCTVSTSTTNGGSVTVRAQAQDMDGNLSGWVSPQTLIGLDAQTVQFTAEYHSTTPGSSTAQVNSASVIYGRGNAIIPEVLGAEIFTKTLDWYTPIHHSRVTVFHHELGDSSISAFTAFRDSPSQIRRESLGVGTGAKKTFALAHTNGIRYDSFILYFDGVRTFTDFDLNTETGRVTCTAPSGVTVSCDYDYGWDSENWEQMTLSSRVLMGDIFRSEYTLSTPNNYKSAAVVKLKLSPVSGHTNNEVLGTAAGSAKSFKLAHIINNGNISVTANNSTLSPSYWRVLEDPQYISVAAASGATIRASYDWVSEPPRIVKFSIVFSE